LLGKREGTGQPFRYLRIPADENDSLDGWFRLRAALADAGLRQQAVARYVKTAVEPSRPELLTALTASAQRAIDLFAGADPVLASMSSGPVPLAGLQAVSQFMEGNVPEAERERAGEVLVRILNGVLFELNQVAREKQGLKPSPQDEATRGFMTQSVLSLSDSFFYRAPMTFMLEDFKQVQASVFQVSRAPGKTIVYLGCFFLIVGVFAMLYVRERRVWVWLAPNAPLDDEPGSATGTQATLALSTNRKTMEVDKEFTQLKSRLLLLSS
jgi:cytochrome c biogenesis protein